MNKYKRIGMGRNKFKGKQDPLKKGLLLLQ